MARTPDCMARMLRWEERAEGYLADANQLIVESERSVTGRAEQLHTKAQLRILQARVAADGMKAWATLAETLKEPGGPHE